MHSHTPDFTAIFRLQSRDTFSKYNIRCMLAYAGTRYFGWQKTEAGPSIEGTVQNCLEKTLQHPVLLQAASRTDRGVHAEKQVINFFTTNEELDLGKLARSLRYLLPQDISLLSLDFAPLDFHPTLDAKRKEYHYQVCPFPTQCPFKRDYSWHYPFQTLNLEIMTNGAKLLEGTHDFSAFSSQNYADPVRTIQKFDLICLDKGRLCFQIIGDHFLYKMVRNLVGTLIYIGAGKIHLENLSEILKQKQRKFSGVTAPAHGLTLKEIFY